MWDNISRQVSSTVLVVFDILINCDLMTENSSRSRKCELKTPANELMISVRCSADYWKGFRLLLVGALQCFNFPA